MSVTSIMNNALSALQASQAGLQVTSNNISNVNTPGYARQEVGLSARVIGAVGAGVSVDEIRRISDDFLVRASMLATSREAASGVEYELLDRAQAAFGDPANENSVFNTLNRVFATFAEAAADPASTVRRANVLSDLNATFAEFDRISSEIDALRVEADARIAASVDRANDLIEQITQLNGAVQRGALAGDAAGAENALAQALDELSSIMDIRVIPRDRGAVEVRTTDGVLLAGEIAATLSYAGGGANAAGAVYPPIWAEFGPAAPVELDAHVISGELRGLIDMRDRDLPALSAQLAEFAARTADAINRAHNEAVAHPAPQVLEGRQTGLLAGDSHGFTGQSQIVLLDDTGAWRERLLIDFDAGQVAVEGGLTFAFGGTVGDLTTALDAALGANNGSATFTNGVLTLDGGDYNLAPIQAVSPTAPTTEADRAGRGFSHFFGLNDLVRSTKPLTYETGVSVGDATGFAAGQQTAFRLVDENGREVATADFTAAAGDTFGDVRDRLNDPTTGLGAFGRFELDPGPGPNTGAMTFTASPGYENVRLQVVEDSTTRGGTNVSLSSFFGLGEGVRDGRAAGLAIRDDITSDHRRLSLGQLDLTGRVQGELVTGAGDGAGGQALQAVGAERITFAAAGDLPVSVSTLADYAGRLAGDAGRRASSAERARDAAETLRTEADTRRGSVEGVNIDEELIKLTQFQQSFAAASRLIQAADEMTDILLSVV